nr:hypothetical protein [Tanacetum cinerariifolium]
MASCKPGKTPTKETISRGYCAIASGCYKEVTTSFIQNLRTFSPDGSNSLYVDDPALDPEATLIEDPHTSCIITSFNTLALITPGWVAAFASLPAAMSFAMIAAGAAESEAVPPTPTINIHLKHANLKDKVVARAAALAVARNLKRNNKISSGRGLSVVAIATSSQR